MSICSSFCNIAKRLVTPISFIHGAAYSTWLGEDEGSKPMTENEILEMVYRILILLGTAAAVKFLLYLYHKIPPCKKGAAPAVDAAALEKLLDDANQTKDKPSCWAKTKKVAKDFHAGFGLSAGPLSLLYAFFPVMGIKKSLEIQVLSTISTVGTVGGLGNAGYQGCKKKP